MTRADEARRAIPKLKMSDFQESNTRPAAACAWLNHADAFARSEPAKAVVSAFGTGFLITLLPVGAIIGALATVAFALVRPILLIFGLIKVCELCPCRKPSNI